MLNMREVINYKPDIFTRCFCILALLVKHGCRCISSSCVCVLSLSSSLTFSLPRWPWGPIFIALTALRGKMSQCKTAGVTVVPSFQRFSLSAYSYSYCIVFLYLYMFQSWSARSICFVPGAKMIR